MYIPHCRNGFYVHGASFTTPLILELVPNTLFFIAMSFLNADILKKSLILRILYYVFWVKKERETILSSSPTYKEKIPEEKIPGTAKRIRTGKLQPSIHKTRILKQVINTQGYRSRTTHLEVRTTHSGSRSAHSGSRPSKGRLGTPIGGFRPL